MSYLSELKVVELREACYAQVIPPVDGTCRTRNIAIMDIISPLIREIGHLTLQIERQNTEIDEIRKRYNALLSGVK